MKRLPFLCCGVLAAVAFSAAAPARAAVALFDFENQPIGTETPFTLTAGGISAIFAGPALVDPGAFGISSNFPTPTGFQYRLMSVDFLTIGSAFGASGSALTITFSTPISSVAFNFALDDPTHATSLSLSTAAGGNATSMGSLTAGFLYPEGSLSFSGSPFTSLTLQSNAIDFQIDNLQVTTAPVPEPTSLLLMAAGLPFIPLLVRRRARLAVET